MSELEKPANRQKLDFTIDQDQSDSSGDCSSRRAKTAKKDKNKNWGFGAINKIITAPFNYFKKDAVK